MMFSAPVLVCLWMTIGYTIRQTTCMELVLDNSYGSNGELVDDIDDLTSCRAECMRRADECFGLDWDWTQFECYLHGRATECLPLNNRLGVVHYRFVDCASLHSSTRAGDDDSLPNPTPESAAPDTGTPLENALVYPDLAIANGTLISGATTLDDCLAVCSFSRSCQGVDWSELRRECRIHTALTECNDLRNMPGTNHYRVKANCQPVAPTCFYTVFQDYSSAQRTGGSLILSGQTFEDCKQVCRVSSMCQAVTYRSASRQCFMHTTSGLPQPDDCCLHSRKLCDDPTVPPGSTPGVTLPVTPAMPTTLPPAVTTTPVVIADTGKCPAQLQRFPNTRSFDGTPVEGANDTEACKAFCIANVTCAAVDFELELDDADDVRCFWHSNDTYDTDLTENDDDWVQFRKLVDCEPKRCWSTPQLAVSEDFGGGEYEGVDELLSISSNTTDSYPDVVLEECTGLCVIEAAYSINARSGALSSAGAAEAVRYCDTTTPLSESQARGRHCQQQLSGDDDVKNVSIVCFCQTDSCNALWAQALQSTIAHYALDCDTLDGTFAGRDGDNHGMEFSGVDQAKNWSAVFNGSNYIEVRAFTNTLLGQLGPPSNYYITPNFTLFFWCKFTEILEERMTIVSNGPRGQASLDVYTDYSNRTHRSVTSTFKIEGQLHTASVLIPYNEWRYFAARIIPNDVTETLELIVSTGDVTEELDYNIVDTEIPTTETGIRIDPTSNRLAIGRQQTSAPSLGSIPEIVEPEYLVAMLDEVWIFARGLSDFEVSALAEMSFYPQRLDTI